MIRRNTKLSEEDFNRRMTVYADRLDKLFKEGETLERSIKEKLGELKFETGRLP